MIQVTFSNLIVLVYKASVSLCVNIYERVHEHVHERVHELLAAGVVFQAKLCLHVGAFHHVCECQDQCECA